jgi:hypothetical protein
VPTHVSANILLGANSAALRANAVASLTSQTPDVIGPTVLSITKLPAHWTAVGWSETATKWQQHKMS